MILIMADYRRLISYIYEYEGKEKGKNVGFVKLEARNGQCRLNLSVKKIYAGGNAVGVYLLGKGGRKTFLGNIFVRGGNGEFRASVDARNVEGTGVGLDTYYGLTIHDVKSSWRSYTTIWEDAVAAPELEVISTPAEGKKSENGGSDASRGPVAQDILPGSSKENHEQVISNVVKEIEAEIAREEERKSGGIPEAYAAEIGSGEENETAESAAKPDGHAEAENTAKPEDVPEPVGRPAALEQPSQPEAVPEMPSQPEQPVQPEAVPEMPSQPEQPKAPAAAPEIPNTSEAPAAAQESVQRTAEPVNPEPSPELEDPAVLRYLQETESMSADPERLWQELRKSYPKIQPFDYESGCEVLTIRPQDIGRLPRENWVYGNNSFLLHGYYNFRYLILARLENKNGAPRYLIGIPGHYYSNEKYMATMFGFANFVLSKKQPSNDDRFGYWYTDIRMR